MRLRWLGLAGAIMLLASLVLTLAGPRLWPGAYFGDQMGWWAPGGMMGGRGGMMGGYGGMTMMGDPDTMQSMMSGEVTGDPARPFDLRFLDQMIPHHQMAVHSAQMMLANAEQPELRDLAQRIIGAQQAEIGQMLAWRAAWYPDASAAPALMMGGGMMGGGMMHDQAQLSRLFLEMMIPHHEAAISMAEQALDESERPEIRALAEAIISSQRAEIDEMRGYLSDFYGVTTP